MADSILSYTEGSHYDQAPAGPRTESPRSRTGSPRSRPSKIVFLNSPRRTGIKEGRLEMRSGGMVGKFEPRWFRLEEGELRYHEQKEENGPCGELMGSFNAISINDLVLCLDRRECRFQTGGAVSSLIRLRAASEEDAQSWHEAIRNAADVEQRRAQTITDPARDPISVTPTVLPKKGMIERAQTIEDQAEFATRGTTEAPLQRSVLTSAQSISEQAEAPHFGRPGALAQTIADQAEAQTRGRPEARPGREVTQRAWTFQDHSEDSKRTPEAPPHRVMIGRTLTFRDEAETSARKEPETPARKVAAPTVGTPRGDFRITENGTSDSSLSPRAWQHSSSSTSPSPRSMVSPSPRTTVSTSPTAPASVRDGTVRYTSDRASESPASPSKAPRRVPEEGMQQDMVHQAILKKHDHHKERQERLEQKRRQQELRELERIEKEGHEARKVARGKTWLPSELNGQEAAERLYQEHERRLRMQAYQEVRRDKQEREQFKGLQHVFDSKAMREVTQRLNEDSLRRQEKFEKIERDLDSPPRSFRQASTTPPGSPRLPSATPPTSPRFLALYEDHFKRREYVQSLQEKQELEDKAEKQKIWEMIKKSDHKRLLGQPQSARKLEQQSHEHDRTDMLYTDHFNKLQFLENCRRVKKQQRDEEDQQACPFRPQCWPESWRAMHPQEIAVKMRNPDKLRHKPTHAPPVQQRKTVTHKKASVHFYSTLRDHVKLSDIDPNDRDHGTTAFGALTSALTLRCRVDVIDNADGLRCLEEPLKKATAEYRKVQAEYETLESFFRLCQRPCLRLFMDGHLLPETEAWPHNQEPNPLRQLEEDLDELLASAAEAQLMLQELLQPAAQDCVAQAMTALAHSGGDGDESAWEPGQTRKSLAVPEALFAYNPGCKTRAAASVKAFVRYGPADRERRHQHLLDLARLSLVFSSCDLLQAGLENILASFEVLDVRNFFGTPNRLGARYFEVLIAIDVPGRGAASDTLMPHVCELRLELLGYFEARVAAAPHLLEISERLKGVFAGQLVDREAIVYLAQSVLASAPEKNCMRNFRRFFMRHFGTSVCAWRSGLGKGGAPLATFQNFRAVCQALYCETHAAEYFASLSAGASGCVSLFELDPEAVLLLAKLHVRFLSLFLAHEAIEVEPAVLLERLLSLPEKGRGAGSGNRRPTQLDLTEFRRVVKPLGITSAEAEKAFNLLDSQGGSRINPPGIVRVEDLAWLMRRLPALVDLEAATLSSASRLLEQQQQTFDEGRRHSISLAYDEGDEDDGDGAVAHWLVPASRAVPFTGAGKQPRLAGVVRRVMANLRREKNAAITGKVLEVAKQAKAASELESATQLERKETVQLADLADKGLTYLAKALRSVPRVPQPEGVGASEPGFKGGVDDFREAYALDEECLGRLQNKVLLCEECGRPNAACLQFCGACEESLEGAEIAYNDNVFMGFVYGIGWSRIPFTMSLRSQSSSALCFDDVLSLAPCHLNAIPTDVYIPDLRYLFADPERGLALVNALFELTANVALEQFWGNAEFQERVFCGVPRPPSPAALEELVLSGFVFPPTMHQLHLQFIHPPLMPLHFLQAEKGESETLRYGRFFPLAYLRQALARGKAARMDISEKTSIGSIIDRILSLGIDYDKCHEDMLERCKALHRRFPAWREEDFQCKVVDGQVMDIKSGCQCPDLDRQQLQRQDKFALQSYGWPLDANGRPTGSYYSFPKAPAEVTEFVAKKIDMY